MTSRSGRLTARRRTPGPVYGGAVTDDEASRTHPHHPGTHRRPTLLVFDVNETLSDMSPLATRFEDVGVPGHVATSWFAGVLRDGFSLTSLGVNPSFASIAEESVRVLMDGRTSDRGTEKAVQHVMDGFAGLSVHPDVVEGVRTLAAGGLRMITLSNGSAPVAEGLLERAGIREHFEAVLSVEDAPLWKPSASAYAYALQQCAVESTNAMLVAVHPWDIDGAARAGLSTAWINRDGDPYPSYFTPADLAVSSLIGLSTELTG